MTTRVYQKSINSQTQQLVEQTLKAEMERPKNNDLIDSYREAKRRMAEAEARKATDELVNEFTASEPYRKWLAKELKADERRTKKRMPKDNLKRVQLYITQLKQSLPAVIPTVTHFDQSTDQWGRKGAWRLQQYAHLSALAVLDADHISDPEKRIEEWMRRDDFDTLGIVWIFITPSGKGIKVVFKARTEWGNLQDNAYQMAELLGILDYADGQTKNADHAHFIPKMSDVKYIDWETLFSYENPAYEERYGEAYRRGESEPTQQRWQELERQRKESRRQAATQTGNGQTTTQPETVSCQAGNLGEREQAIAKMLNEHYGATVAEGHRHETFLSETAPWLLMLNDNNPQKALAIALQLDYVKNWTDLAPDELQNCISTVQKKPLMRKRPKALVELTERAGIDKGSSTATKLFTDPMTALPFDEWCNRIEQFFDVYPCLREVCEPHPRRLWPFLLFASAAMMGTDMDLCYYYFYADESERSRLNYIVWGVGDPTSGKRCLMRLNDLLLAPVIEEGKIADDSTNTWKETTEAKGANQNKDTRPPMYNRVFGYRSSNAEFIRSMANCKEIVDGEEMGRHMVTVSTEKDVEIGKSGSWISRSNMLLLSFHGEWDDQHYSNKQSVSGRFRVFWNMCETFTPPTLKKLINEKSVNSGLDTRTATIPMLSDDFTMMPLRRKEDSNVEAYNETLRQWAYKLDQRRGELPLWPLVEHVHKWCDDKRAIAEFNDKDKADWLLIKRCPYYGIHVSAPYIDMRHWEEREQTGTYVIDDTDRSLCDLVLDIQYQTQLYWYYDLHRKYYDDQLRDAAQQHRRTNKYVECFRRLPEEFTTEQFAQVFGYANNRAGQKTLQRLLEDKAIERTMRGNYQKLVSEL
jgi:hypothetical protein